MVKGPIMDHGMLEYPAAARRNGLGRALAVLGVLVIVLFVFWLAADQEIVAINSPHDDQWFLDKGKNAYWFDDGYSQMSFVKEPVYPLFVAACYRLGLPLRLATQAVYLAAAGFLAWSVVHRQTRGYIGLLLFAVCAVHPMSFHVFRRATYNAVYPSLLMVALGALLLQFKLRHEPGRCWRGLTSGFALALVWHTRPERHLVLALVLFFVAATALADWRRHSRLGSALRSCFREWCPALTTLVVSILVVMSANYARWGIFATTDINAPGYSAACRALLSIRPPHLLPRVQVTREARQLAYAVSPTFGDLAPFLEGDFGKQWSSTGLGYSPNLPPGEIISGLFCWALRDATALAGHYQSASDSETFYWGIAEEIRAAAAEGRLPTRPVPATLSGGFGMDPSLDNYVASLIPSWRTVWTMCWSDRDPETLVNSSADGLRDFFDARACRRAILHEPGRRPAFRKWIYQQYGDLMPTLLATACGVALAVVLLGGGTPGWRQYLFTGTAFALAGFSRLALFALCDAAFCPVACLYMFPAALALTIMTVWWLADGLRLLGGALVKDLQQLAGATQSNESPVGARAERRNGVLIKLGVTVTALVCTTLYFGSSYLESALPRYYFGDSYVEGRVETATSQGIAGWAWDPSHPDDPIEVDVYDGNTLLSSTIADQFREDLSKAGKGNGKHVFSFSAPALWKDGQEHTIRVKRKGTDRELAGSPKTVIFKSP